MDVVPLPLGKLPFRYLGIPLNSKRLSVDDCDQLVDKMTHRIRGWQVKHLSYAARLQLINSVLMVISTYWCQIFILPKMVVKKVNSIYRAFLWNAEHTSTKPCMVKWDYICKPKKEGDLGIRNLEVWNAAAIGKLARHVSSMSESLWVKWVHGVYTKGGNWRLLNPPPTASWVLKKLCKIKEQLAPYVYGNSYSINSVYKDTIGSSATVHWCRVIWFRATVPKHRFIF